MAKAVHVLWLGNQVLRKITGAEDDGLYAAGEVILASARGRAPVRKGRLARSGYVASATRSSYSKSSKTARKQIQVGPGVAVVAFAEFYARFVHGGTQAHAVKTKRARALQVGAERWARRAKVRGSRAVPFLRDAADGEAAQAVERFAGVVKQAIGG